MLEELRQFAESEATRAPEIGEIVTASDSADFKAVAGLLPNPDLVLSNEGEKISVYRTLLADAHVGATVDSLTDGVKALEWSVDRGRARSRYAKETQAWLDDFDLHELIEAVCDARLYGYSPIEIMWEMVGTLMVPVRAVAKPPEWFGYNQERVLMWRTKDKPNEGEPLDRYPRKFLVPTYKGTYANPYGSGVLARCFWPVAFKKGGIAFWMTFAERFGTPKTVIRVPASTTDEQRQRLLTMGRRLIQDAVAVINDTDRVELLDSQSKSASSDLYRTLISTMNEEISKAIKSETLTTQLGDTGSYAAAKTHAAVSATGIDSVKNLVTRTANQIVQWFCEVNWGEGIVMPRIVPYEEEDVDLTLAQRDETLIRGGLSFTRDYYIRTYGFDEDDIPEDWAPPASPAASPAASPVASPSAAPASGGGDPAAGAPAGGEPAATFAEPATGASGQEPSDPLPDQTALDAAIESIDAEIMQEDMETMLQPVLDLVKGARDYSEIEKRLYALYPDMPASAFADRLARVIFVAEMVGRLGATSS